jgi:hypothetical protein
VRGIDELIPEVEVRTRRGAHHRDKQRSRHPTPQPRPRHQSDPRRGGEGAYRTLVTHSPTLLRTEGIGYRAMHAAVGGYLAVRYLTSSTTRPTRCTPQRSTAATSPADGDGAAYTVVAIGVHGRAGSGDQATVRAATPSAIEKG